MSLFGSKKKTEVPVGKPVSARAAHAPVALRADALKRPRVTEKASTLSKEGVYAFEVRKNATKREIAEAVRALYKVVPEKIRIVAVPAKRIIVKGRPGIRSGNKKAYVRLKKGDKIEVV